MVSQTFREPQDEAQGRAVINGVAPDSDLSDIVENLLAKWIFDNSNA